MTLASTSRWEPSFIPDIRMLVPLDYNIVPENPTLLIEFRIYPRDLCLPFRSTSHVLPSLQIYHGKPVPLRLQWYRAALIKSVRFPAIRLNTALQSPFSRIWIAFFHPLCSYKQNHHFHYDLSKSRPLKISLSHSKATLFTGATGCVHSAIRHLESIVLWIFTLRFEKTVYKTINNSTFFLLTC